MRAPVQVLTSRTMHRSAFALSIVFLVVVGCGSSSDDAPQQDSSVDAPAQDTAIEDVTDTTPPPVDANCPAVGSSCPAEAFIGCVTQWDNVNRVECHDGRWCAEPKNDPTSSDEGCPSTVPTGGSACTPPSGVDGYQWCGYTCGDGAVHAMICAAGIWCGDATSSCTLVPPATDAGSDATDASDAGDAADEASTDASDAD